MTELDLLRARLTTLRGEVRDAEALASRTRWSLAQGDAALVEALRAGDADAIERAEGERATAEHEHLEAAGRFSGLNDRLLAGIAGFVDALHDQPDHVGEAVLALVDRSFPIALFPVRLETRFAGPPTAPVLKVRIYPDDLHVDDHEPDLSQEEVVQGEAYWRAVRDGASEVDSWAVLAGRLGPHRALWVRERLEPTDDAAPPTFPDVAFRAPGTSRPAVARALPDLFLVRVRANGTTTITSGRPIADTLQVGIDLSGTPSAPPAAETADLDDDVVVLGEDARWLSDFTAAVEAGMAVEVPLPANTELVDEVAVAGVCISLTPDEGSAIVDDLVSRHRVTHGAGFISPGTPTNNLADTTSGWLSRPDPARLDPADRSPVGDASDAAVLAGALGLATARFAGLVGAADANGSEVEIMARALFEATWGPYLRTQAQPGFPLRLLPEAYAHVTRWVKSGGPLPALRLGRQPYGILPIQPRQTWAPAGDDTFTTWLAGYLPRIRSLWLAGRVDVPSGLAAYAHEPVSSRFRVRTTNASSTRPWATELGLIDGTEGGIQDRRLVAELALGTVLPSVVSQIFVRGAADLWMPLSNDEDLSFPVSAPNPKEATSVLGLLLRNAALQVTTNLADELSSPLVDPEVKGYAATPAPTFSLTGLSGLAVSATSEIAIGAVPALQEKLALHTTDEHGTETTVADRIQELIADFDPITDAGHYRHAEASGAFRGALEDLVAIPTDRRARLAGEVLDAASHRYDAWVTSLATRRLGQLREANPTGLQLGAWGVVQGIRRRTLPSVDRDDLPESTTRDEANRGFVVAPSPQHADVAGVLRAAWIAHGGPSGEPDGPFAVDLRSQRVRQALALADGMRNGQQLGALLGYQLERALHDASGNGTEVDWAVFELRRSYPLAVSSAENANLPSERLVVDGWRVVQDALSDLGAVLDAVVDQVPPGLDPDRCRLAVSDAVTGLIGSLDGLTDLGLAEAMYQLAGSNFARASAVTDMLGRAAMPPDSFDVATTPRGGQGIDQRLVVVFAGADRPAGYSATTPRADLAPEADAFVARRLGELAGISVRLLGEDGTEIGSCALADLGLSALDLAADAASRGSSSPFPLLLARSRTVSGHPEAATLGLDPHADGALVDVLECAARWHQALANRRPLSAASLLPRGRDLPADGPTADDGGRAAVQARVEELAAATGADDPGDHAPLDLETLALWGFDPGSSQAGARAVLTRRLAEARAATDPAVAARALFGSDCVVSGSVLLDQAAPWTVDQELLGISHGDLVGWIQDTGRVRDAAHALDEALLHGELAEGGAGVSIGAGQDPAVPGVIDPSRPDEAEAARRWVGRAFPGQRGNQPVVSFVVVHDGEGATPGATPGQEVTGIELDSWIEVVPDRRGAGAIAANIASPDSRAPNTILLAVPADVGAPWTRESLFSVIDEALELAECRLVDLDASRQHADERRWRELLHQRVEFPTRYIAKGTP